MAEYHLVETASALHYGLDVQDEDDGETRRGLPLPEDAPVRLLLLVRPDVVMDLGDAIRSALQAYLDATKGDV